MLVKYTAKINPFKNDIFKTFTKSKQVTRLTYNFLIFMHFKDQKIVQNVFWRFFRSKGSRGGVGFIEG